jgi:hypothetical protein
MGPADLLENGFSQEPIFSMDRCQDILKGCSDMKIGG